MSTQIETDNTTDDNRRFSRFRDLSILPMDEYLELPSAQLGNNNSNSFEGNESFFRDEEMGRNRDEKDGEHSNSRASDEGRINGVTDDQKKDKPVSSGSRLLQIANYWDVLAFGICLTSANITYGYWHIGLILGFWSFFFAFLIMSSVFFCIHLCIAEMISILPFSGGMYGFARVTLGPYFGFLAGIFEATANIIYAMYGTLLLGAYFTYMTHGERKNEPAYWLFFYIIIAINEFLGRKFYFRMIRLLAVVIVLIFLFYIGESIPLTHPHKYLPANTIDQTFHSGRELTLVSLQFAAFLYFAVEIMPLVSDEVKQPRQTTPKAVLSTMTFIFITAILVMFLAYCQYPGYPLVLAVSVAPLNSGFTNTFQIDDRIATAFAYIPLIASISIYVFGFAKQLKALGDSRLLPPVVAWTLPKTNIPYVALIIGCVIGYAISLLCYFRNDIYENETIPTGLYLTGFVFTYCTLIMVLISFIIFRLKYWTLPRAFKNPLGIASAIYGILGLLVLLYVLFRYTSKDYTFVKIFACYFGIVTVYYYGYGRYQQIFSEEEQVILFKVYLMKTNERKRQALIHTKSAYSRPQNQPHPPTPYRHESLVTEDNNDPKGSVTKNQIIKSTSFSFLKPYPLDFSKILKPSYYRSTNSSVRTVTPSTVTSRKIHPFLVTSSSNTVTCGPSKRTEEEDESDPVHRIDEETSLE